MSTELVAKIRKQREFKVKVGRFTFTARRPTDAEFIAFAQRGGVNYHDVASDFIVDWEGITEDDIVGGGGSDKVKFDMRLWREWVADRADFWEPIATPIIDSYNAHKTKLEDAAKNSPPGSN